MRIPLLICPRASPSTRTEQAVKASAPAVVRILAAAILLLAPPREALPAGADPADPPPAGGSAPDGQTPPDSTGADPGTGTSADPAAAPETTPSSQVSGAATFEEYLSTLNHQEREYLRESWSRHPKAREANGLLFLEYESARPRSRGHLFLFPSWKATSRLTPLAEAAAAAGYDCFVFLPIPEITGHLPTSEDQEETAPVRDAFMNYVRAALETIGTHDTVNLVLAAGDTISWILSGIEEGVIPSPQGIIAYNAAYRDFDANSLVATQLSTYKGHFADIVTEEANLWLKDAWEKRAFMFRKKGRKKNTVKLLRCGDGEDLTGKFAGYVRKTAFASGRRGAGAGGSGGNAGSRPARGGTAAPAK